MTDTRNTAAKYGLHIVTVGDLTISEDGRVATLEVEGVTYDVLRADLFGSISSLVEGVKNAPEGPYDDMNPWVQEDAFEAGIRVEF